MISLIVLLLILTGGAYGYGVWYFTGHFLPGSMVNGFNCSYMTVEESEALLSKKAGAGVLAIETRNNGQESITAQQVGLSYASDGSIKKLMRDQDRFIWFLAFNQEQIYTVSSAIQYDEQEMQAAISGLKCMQTGQDPVDAHIDEQNDKFVIIPEEEGNALDPEKTSQAVILAFVTGQTSLDLEAEGCYKEPAVRQDDEMLIRNCEQINKLTDVVITYDFDDRTETVDKEVIRDWLKKNKKGDYTLDKKQVSAYVSELAEKYDTVGQERTFHTYDGREITLNEGTYGWEINQEAEVKELISLIKKGKTLVREPVYSQEGALQKDK